MFRIAVLIGALPLCLFAQKPANKEPVSSNQSAPKSALDKTSLADYIRHQFLLPPNLQVTASEPMPSEVPGLKKMEVYVSDGSGTRQQVDFLVSSDGTKIVQGKVYDIRESPFAAELKILSKTDGLARMGPATAPVTLVVFSDFQCPYCKEQAKILRQNLKGIYGEKVRMFFKDLPIEQIHPWAKPASLIGRCIKRAGDERFWQYHDWVFENQASFTLDNIKAKSLEFANKNAMDTLMLGQCIEGKVTEPEVAAAAADARALQVASTPTAFVNGRRLVGNLPWDQMKAVLDYEIDYAQKHANEPCCEAKVAIPGVK
jgi:protein-disulfide isomerase